jgi:hypothetical protein
VTTVPTTAAPVTTATLPPPTTSSTTTSTSSTTTPATTTTAPYPVAAAEADVAALYDALNDGWALGVLSHLPAEPMAGWPGLAQTGWDGAVSILVDGGDARVAVQCDPGERTDDGTVLVRCEQQIVDDLFYTPAGVTWTEMVVWEADATGLIPVEGIPIWVAEPKGDARAYLVDFDSWLLERHRQEAVWGWIWLYREEGLYPNHMDGHTCCPYSVASATGAQAVFELVPEFLSESDDWPVVLLSDEEALALVEAHYDALNAGESPHIGSPTRNLRRALGFNAVFGADCRVEENRVLCVERVTDDFYGPAGFVVENTMVYRIAGNGVRLDREDSATCLTDSVSEPWGAALDYVFAFDRWLLRTHGAPPCWNPLHGQAAAIPCSFYPITTDTPDPVIAEYVREFVEQSDEYPLDPVVVVVGRSRPW